MAVTSPTMEQRVRPGAERNGCRGCLIPWAAGDVGAILPGFLCLQFSLSLHKTTRSQRWSSVLGLTDSCCVGESPRSPPLSFFLLFLPKASPQFSLPSLRHRVLLGHALGPVPGNDCQSLGQTSYKGRCLWCPDSPGWLYDHAHFTDEDNEDQRDWPKNTQGVVRQGFKPRPRQL